MLNFPYREGKMQHLLASLRDEFEDKLKTLKENTVPREVLFEALPNKISVFIGMRRTGKTVFMFQKILALIQQGISISQIFYVNFEDDRLLTPNPQILSAMIDAFYSMYPENHDRHCYLFFDEVQNVTNWSQVIRRLFDSKKVSITLTGSSAKLLSKEIATSLRGRSLSTEIWPFSFQEFLLAKKIDFSKKIIGQRSYDNFKKHLITYLQFGGFPDTTSVSLDIQHQILQDYVNVVVMRDIIERHGITNITLIRYLIKALIRNVGSPFSVNKFFNDIKSQGISASKNTIYEYTEYLQDAYLLFTVPIFSESIRKVHTNPKKIYSIDTGLIGAYTLSLSPNYGHLFENLFYLDLRRKKHEIYYYITNEGHEIDFLSRDPLGKMHLWQIAWDVSDKDTMQREQRALTSAEKELKIQGTLVTPENYLENI